jgi:hypothetical protein
LRTPVSLAAADFGGKGSDELLLYDDKGQPRFDYPAFTAEPVAVDFDGAGKPDVAFGVKGGVAVYRPDGSLRWRHDLTSPVAALSAGDLLGNGHQQLGLSQFNWATVLDAAGKALSDEEVFRYQGLGGAFGEVEGDKHAEFVAVTTSGVNVLKPGQPRRTVMFQSYFGTAPCRVWLRDLDDDGVPECYVGGGGTDPACYDLRDMKCRWTFSGAATHPADIALCDLNDGGKPAIVSGGADGFLYVLSSAGMYQKSQSLGAPICSLVAFTGAGSKSAALAVGLGTGQVVLLGGDLKPLGQALVAEGKAVRHLAVLRRADGPAVLVAADDAGDCLWARTD